MTPASTPRPATPGGRHERPRSRRDRGWTALLALTVLAAGAAAVTAGPGNDAEGDDTSSSTAPPVTSTEPTTAPSADPGRVPTPSPRTGAPVVTRGNGRIVHVPVPGASAGSGREGRPVRWTLEAEEGLGIDLDRYAETVLETLHDRRGWEREDGVRFVHVPRWRVAQGARVDIRVTLASPATTDRLCAPLATKGDVSCWMDGRAVLNSRRWVVGSGSYPGRLGDYRTYLVNHEVGHGLGHGHERCSLGGRRAPVMLQQTLGLQGCLAWPYPVGDRSDAR